MFLPSTFALLATKTNRYDYLQAAEASVMQTKFAEYITALIAENDQRGESNALGIVDMDIAGGGDGHTFVVRILVSDSTDVVWAAGALSSVLGVFWMGADAEALADYQEGALASLSTQAPNLIDVAVGLAGGSKGTRFMAFMAGVTGD